MRALGITYAVREGARVIACTEAGGPQPQLLVDAVRYAEAHCAVALCASAGEGSSAREARSWPPELEAGRAIWVAASNPRNDHAPLPDVQRVPASSWEVAQGTRAGAAALLLEARPDLDAAAIRDLWRRHPRASLDQQQRLARQLPRGRCAAVPSGQPEPLWRGHVRVSPGVQGAASD